MVCTYITSWALKVPLGIIRPAANLRYFCYSDFKAMAAALDAFYWPCYKPLSTPDLKHNQDRPKFRSEDMGPERFRGMRTRDS